MIIDGLTNINLAVGVDRRIIEDGDTQVAIPAAIFPTLLTLSPHNVAPTAIIVQNQSAIYEAQATLTNGVGVSPAFATLSKGLYEFEMSMASAFNFVTAAGAFGGCAIAITYQGATTNLVKRIASVGSFVDYNRMRVLLISQATLSTTVSTNGIGQTTDMNVIVNVIRIL